MATLVRVGDLEVPQDLALERRNARIRAVATGAGLLLLVVACLGVLGRSGPLADADVTTPGGAARLSYARYLQYSTSDELSIRFQSADGGRAYVGFSNSYLASVNVQATSAQPTGVTVHPDRTVYAFAVDPPATVTFTIEPQSIGRMDGLVYGSNGTPASFSQWVYP
jgi:hypothetical protein